MIGLPLLAAAASHAPTSTAAPAAPLPAVDVRVELAQIAHAIEAGRYDQAKAMIADAAARNAPGRETGRLVAGPGLCHR